MSQVARAICTVHRKGTAGGVTPEARQQLRNTAIETRTMSSEEPNPFDLFGKFRPKFPESRLIGNVFPGDTV